MTNIEITAARRAQWAVAAIFFTSGFVVGSWAPHIPLVQERHGLSPADLGFALLALAAGAVLAMPTTGTFIGRFGSAAVTRTMAIANCLFLPLPVLAPNVWSLVLALIFFGASIGALDVAMNAHGVAVEKRLPRPTMSGFHGSWSLGGLAGAGSAGILLSFTGDATHAALVGAGGFVVMLVAATWLLHRIDAGTAGALRFALPRGLALALGALAFLVLLGEGAILDWSAVYLRSTLAADTTIAAMGYAAFSGAMAVARFAGDRLRSHFGAVRIVRASAVLATLGLGAGLAAGNATAAIMGFAVAGFGLANLVPVLFSAAGRLPGQSPGTGIAAVATMGYAGFLAGPPLIGFVAEVSSLPVGLALVPVSIAIVGLAAAIVGVADRSVEHDATPASQAG